ncbi:hypothetical protein CLOL250_02075 [Clostridium sp. L2-50]|nr:hypothetical protein CLOL250_02075 [Clostridium sp. L2-50]
MFSGSSRKEEIPLDTIEEQFYRSSIHDWEVVSTRDALSI